MITEDYVSFEVAKLLKEKGFWENCPFSLSKLDEQTGEAETVRCPTLQMAMKWLRIKHDIVCSVGLFTDLPETPPYWSFNILNQSTANVMYEAFDVKCKTYEEACETAIKYCLENLI